MYVIRIGPGEQKEGREGQGRKSRPRDRSKRKREDQLENKQRLSVWGAGRLGVSLFLPSSPFVFLCSCASHVSSIYLWTRLVPRAWVGWRSSVFYWQPCLVLFVFFFVSVLQLPRAIQVISPVIFASFSLPLPLLRGLKKRDQQVCRILKGKDGDFKRRRIDRDKETRRETDRRQDRQKVRGLENTRKRQKL